MAIMYPDHPLGETKSNAERKVFYALKESLSNEYMVFHSVPIYRRPNKNGPLLDGEIDFIVLHPENGMLVLEVKGGGVELNGQTGEWFSTSFDGKKHKIKNPYEQSKSYCYDIINDLKRNPSTRRISLSFGHAVWFPDVNLDGKDIGLSTEMKGITLDLTDLRRISKAINNTFKKSLGIKSKKGPNKEGLKSIQKYLAPSWKIPISLSKKIETDKETIYDATKSQYKVLTLIERFKRATICGPAGSGKTFLAIEKARRIAQIDKKLRVLIVCFNNKLADYLKKVVSHHETVNVYSFHSLCTEFCRKANLDIPVADPNIERQNYYKYDLPDILLDALDLIDDRYDALIVDEAQDFEDNWWLPLQEVLKDPEEGMFYIFYDNNQRIYRKNNSFPLNGPPFYLSENCRNTKQIHEEAMKYYTGDTNVNAIGPDGRLPLVINIETKNKEKGVVEKIISDLLKKEKVNPSDIVLLTPRSENKSIWVTGERIFNCYITWQLNDKWNGNKLLCSTIHSFKGMESPIVILSETDSIWIKNKDELLYIATSRAISHLVICKTTE